MTCGRGAIVGALLRYVIDKINGFRCNRQYQSVLSIMPIGMAASDAPTSNEYVYAGGIGCTVQCIQGHRVACRARSSAGG